MNNRYLATFILLLTLILASCSTTQSHITREIAATDNCNSLMAVFTGHEKESPALEGLSKKFKSTKELSPVEEKFLRELFINGPEEFLVNKNNLSFHKAAFKNLSMEDVLSVLKKLWASPNKDELIEHLDDLLKGYDYSEAFFLFFDLNDIAIAKSKGLHEKLSIQQMIENARFYERALDEMHLEDVVNDQDFMEVTSAFIGLAYQVRNRDVVMAPFIKGVDGLRLSKEAVKKYKENQLLSIEGMKPASSKLFEVSYFSLDHIEKIKGLFTKREYVEIDQMWDTDPGNAVHEAVSVLLKKFFQPREFRNILNNVFKKEETGPLSRIRNAFKEKESAEPYTAYSLYKAFVSLHAGRDGNGRAARLYYRWLVKNHFPKEALNPRIPVNEGDLLISSPGLKEMGEIDEKNNSDLSWYVARLWVLSGTSETDMMNRARKVLNNERYHKSFSDTLPYLKDLYTPPAR